MREVIAPFLKLSAIALLLVGIITVPPFSRIYLAELASHFRVQMAVISLFVWLMLCRDCTPVDQRFRRVSWRMLAFIPFALSAAFIVGWYLPSTTGPPESGAGPQNVRLLIVNVHTSNLQHEKLIELIEGEQPDVIALVEVDRHWLKSLEPLHERYPDRIEIPRDDNFGIAVFSSMYIVHSEQFALGDDQPPAIHIDVWSDDNRELTIVAGHTYPPVRRRLMNARNRQLEVLARHMTSIEGPRVLVGDFNVSMFSPYYCDLVGTTGLHNARQGFGILPTWPTRRPPMMIPIDHCLHSEDIEIRDCRTGSDIGSDHLPFIVDLAY